MVATVGANGIKIVENANKIGTNTDVSNLKEQYYDDLFANLRENQYGDAKLTAEQEKDLDTVVMNAINYASQTVANRDGKNTLSGKDGAVGLSEWATESTYQFLGLDIYNKDDVKKMKSIFDAMDEDNNGKLDEKELMAVYLYKDATSDGMPEEGTITLDGSVNSGKERTGLAANMVSLADNDGKTLFDSLFSLIGTKAPKAPENEDGAKKGGYGTLNGVIEASAQGDYMGDCWFLSGLTSFSYSDKGRQIIQDTIKDNGDGTYTVNLQGVKQSYSFSEAEITEARNSGNYSTGDDDVLLMEIATERFLRELSSGKVKVSDDAPNFLSEEDRQEGANPLNGGSPNHTLYLLTGKTANNQYNTEHPFYAEFVATYGIQADNPCEGYSTGTSLDYAYDKIEENDGNVWATMVVGYDDKTKCEITDVNGNKITLTNAECHALSIKSVKGDVVTLVNPWDTTAEINVTKDEVKKFASDIYFAIM